MTQAERVAHVLVVDDRMEMADMVADELRDRGYRATALNSGRAAVDLLEREIFDALVTDFRMPEVDGLTLLRASRALDPTRPVIIMTAYGAMDAALEADRHGAFQYIVKPFTLAKLVGLLRRALALRAAEGEDE